MLRFQTLMQAHVLGFAAGAVGERSEMRFGRAEPATSTPGDERGGGDQDQRGRNDPFHRHGSCHHGHQQPRRPPRWSRCLKSGTLTHDDVQFLDDRTGAKPTGDPRGAWSVDSEVAASRWRQ